VIAAALAPLLLASAAAGGLPPPGHYEAQLCVAVAAQPPSCGAAEARLGVGGEIRVRVQDIAYHLSFDQGLLLGITTHGNMQVADFSSSYRWVGTTLMFGDRPRGLNYELQLGAPLEPGR
jgi:hypothetical protein